MSKRPTPGQAHRELAIVLAPGQYSHAAVVRAKASLAKVVKAKRKGKKKARKGRGKHRVLFRRVKRVNRCPYCRKKIRGGRTGLAQHLAYQHDGRGVAVLMGRVGHWSTHSYPHGKKPRGKHPGRKKHPRTTKHKSRKKARKGRPSKRRAATKNRKRRADGTFAKKRKASKKKSRKTSKKKSKAKSKKKSQKKARKKARTAAQKAATARLVAYNRTRRSGQLFLPGFGPKPRKRRLSKAQKKALKKASRQLSKVNWEGIGAAMQAGQTGHAQGDIAGYHRSQTQVRNDLERAARRARAMVRLARIKAKRAFSFSPREDNEIRDRRNDLKLSLKELHDIEEARKAGLIK